MRIPQYLLALTCSPVVLALLLAGGWAPRALADDYDDQLSQRRGFEPVQLALDGQNLYSVCRELASLHLDVLRRLPPLGAGNDRESKEAEMRYEASLERLELEFLSREAWTLESIARQLRSFEQQGLNAPAAQIKMIPIGELGSLCRLASETLGSRGLVSLPQALKEGAAAIGKLDGLASAALKKLDDNSDKPARENSPASSASEAEDYRKKRQRWEAHLREQELAAEERETLYAASLRERAARPVAPPVEAKVGTRKDLPPPATPAPPQVDPGLAQAMASWHRAYWNGVKTFKFDLSQLMSLTGPKTYARREACKKVYASAAELLAHKLLEAPDPAVHAAAIGMVQEFQQGAMTCVENKDQEMQQHMAAAQTRLGQMAAALTPYGLTP